MSRSTSRCSGLAAASSIDRRSGLAAYWIHSADTGQRGNGSAFSANVNAKVERSQWTLEGPEDEVAEFEHGPGMFNAFCSRCGSPLYARSSHDPDDIPVRLGGFEGNLDVEVTEHVWTSSKSTWYSIEDSLPCHLEAITP